MLGFFCKTGAKANALWFHCCMSSFLPNVI